MTCNANHPARPTDFCRRHVTLTDARKSRACGVDDLGDGVVMDNRGGLSL